MKCCLFLIVRVKHFKVPVSPNEFYHTAPCQTGQIRGRVQYPFLRMRQCRERVHPPVLTNPPERIENMKQEVRMRFDCHFSWHVFQRYDEWDKQQDRNAKSSLPTSWSNTAEEKNQRKDQIREKRNKELKRGAQIFWTWKEKDLVLIWQRIRQQDRVPIQVMLSSMKNFLLRNIKWSRKTTWQCIIVFKRFLCQ